MRNHVRHSRSERPQADLEEQPERDIPLVLLADEPDEADDPLDAEYGYAFEEDLGDVVRLYCPDCARPIAVLTDEESLPEHALCATPWNPFGLTVCAGSGRPVSTAKPVDGISALEGAVAGDSGLELAALLTLPAGLDWRTQPFSHVGGPGSRPMRVPGRQLAA